MTSLQWRAVKLAGRRVRVLGSGVILGLFLLSQAATLSAADSSPISSDRAREDPTGSDKPEGTKLPGVEASSSPKPAAAEEKDRSAVDINPITGVGTVSAAGYQKLTGRERWHLYIKQNFTTVGAYLGVFTGSILDQIGNQPPEWEQGLEGYGHRMLSRFGAGVIQGSIQGSACAALGQDPRYIRSGSEQAWHRVGHAFLYSLLTYNNEGKPRPALATLGSYYASSMIATAWLPTRYTPLGDGVRDGNRQVILAGFSNLIQEFWPEIKKVISRK